MSRTARPTDDAPAPPLYASVQPGLEPVAADEITRDLGGDVRKTSRGVVVFRVPKITPDVLALRCTEDVFVLAWGSDSLTFKTSDLGNLRKWTANRPDWPALFKVHHALRPAKGRPTFNLVCQMRGEHGYRRVDALDALATGLNGKIPAAWFPQDENPWLEIWMTIRGETAVCGVRLSDRTMRHRTYKTEHMIASLRPTVAAAMVRLAGVAPGMTVLDPMCGAGTIAAETIEMAKARRYQTVEVLAGDIDKNAVFITKENLVGVGPAAVTRWDARELPLAPDTVDRIITNPPFGEQLASPDEIPPLYTDIAREYDRVLKPGGRAVFLVSDQDTLTAAVKRVRWIPVRR
ncbi:MAG: methyltransferase, partial [Fimbriiglobus sp.]